MRLSLFALPVVLLVACGDDPNDGSDGPIVQDTDLASADLASADLVTSPPDLLPTPYGVQRPVSKDDTTKFGTVPPNGYYEYLPSQYGVDPTRKWPLLIALHGIGEVGDGKLDAGGNGDLKKLLNNGLTPLIQSGKFPAHDRMVVLLPQGAGYFSPAGIEAFLAWAKAHYNVDDAHLFLTGLSYGAMASWDYENQKGAAVQFTALVLVSGHGAGGNPDCTKFMNVPFWAFHGDSDSNNPTRVQLDEDAYHKIKACPTPPVKPFRLTIFKGVDHNAWDMTYNLSGMTKPTDIAYDPYTENVYDWMMAQTR